MNRDLASATYAVVVLILGAGAVCARASDKVTHVRISGPRWVACHAGDAAAAVEAEQAAVLAEAPAGSTLHAWRFTEVHVGDVTVEIDLTTPAGVYDTRTTSRLQLVGSRWCVRSRATKDRGDE